MRCLKLQILKHRSSESPPTQSQPAQIHLPPLNLAAPEIRLLTLFPAEDKASELCITLTTVSLLANPTYEALSYTWGEQTQRLHINLDGQKFPVTKNLEVALRHLRRRSETRTLWIDAACIDQNNIRERNHQVQQMRLIYSQASQVLIWLGEAGNYTDEAMDYIAGFDTFLAFPRWVESQLSRIQLEGIQDIFTRPWWSRMWVVQEVLVAVHKPLVGCGEKWITWDTISFLGLALYRYHLKGEFDGLLRQDWTWFISTTILRSSWQHTKDEGLPLDDLLLTTKDRFATDPRDHVLAVLGLADKATQRMLLPNYEESVSQIYQKATVICIRSSGRLIHLLDALRSHRQDLPSWCPDFSKDWKIDKDLRRGYAPGIATATATATVPSKIDNGIQSNLPQGTNSSTELPTHMNQAIEDAPGQTGENSKGGGENEQLGSPASWYGACAMIKCSYPLHDPATSTLTVSGVVVGVLDNVIKSRCKGKEEALEGGGKLPEWALRPVKQEEEGEDWDAVNVSTIWKEIVQFQMLVLAALVRRLGVVEAMSSLDKGSLWITLLQGEGNDDKFRNLFPNFNADGGGGGGGGEAGFYTRVAFAQHTAMTSSGQGQQQRMDPELRLICYLLSLSMANCSYFTTQSGYFGRATNNIKKGDILCVLFGCPMPMILRPYGRTIITAATSKRIYKVIDSACVNDLMNGEFVQDTDNLKVRLFDLR